MTAASTDGTETDINVTANLTANSFCTINGNRNIVIQSSGGPYTVTYADSGYNNALFMLESGGKLTLKDSMLT